MGVDESLARGLTSRLFAEVLQRTQELTRNPDSLRFRREEKRQRWHRAAEELVARNRELILAHFISASKRDPTLIFSFLITDEGAHFQDCGEKCLTGIVTQLSYKQLLATPAFHHCLEISAHAVQRVLQRAEIGFVADQFDRSGLLEEIRPLANWAGFVSVFLNVVAMPEGVELFPVLASARGLYLCHSVRKMVSGVSVRTFVGSHQLRPEQTVLRDALIREMQWAERVPYFIFPLGDGPPLKTLGVAMSVHIARLRSIYRQWATELAGGDEAPPRLVQTLVEELERIGDSGEEAVRRFGWAGLSGRQCFDLYFRIAQDGKTVRRA